MAFRLFILTPTTKNASASAFIAFQLPSLYYRLATRCLRAVLLVLVLLTLPRALRATATRNVLSVIYKSYYWWDDIIGRASMIQRCTHSYTHETRLTSFDTQLSYMALWKRRYTHASMKRFSFSSYAPLPAHLYCILFRECLTIFFKRDNRAWLRDFHAECRRL